MALHSNLLATELEVIPIIMNVRAKNPSQVCPVSKSTHGIRLSLEDLNIQDAQSQHTHVEEESDSLLGFQAERPSNNAK